MNVDRDSPPHKIGMFGMVYKVGSQEINYLLMGRSGRFDMVPFQDWFEKSGEYFHMRIVTPSLVFAMRVFKRRVIQYFLKEGRLEDAKAIGRARMYHPEDRFPPSPVPKSMLPYIMDWDNSKLWKRWNEYTQDHGSPKDRLWLKSTCKACGKKVKKTTFDKDWHHVEIDDWLACRKICKKKRY